MKFEDLPKKIAIFPLYNAIFFPRTVLPLNIFEKRYLQLVNDSIRKQRIFGIVQPKRNKNIKLIKTRPEVYTIGCLGKIINFNETEDNRLIITLFGLSRFKIIEEINNNKLYREFAVDYSIFIEDLNTNNLSKVKMENNSLINKIKMYFKKKEYFLNWNELEKLDYEQLVNTICMIAPLPIEEKQKLLETEKIKDKSNILNEILNFNLQSEIKNETIQ